MSCSRVVPGVCLLTVIVTYTIGFGQEAKNQPGITIVDATGKDVMPKSWKVVGGLRKLGWVDGKPDAFEFREFGSTTFKDGVITWIPLSRIKGIRYDYDKETALVEVAGLAEPLRGTTKYRDINMITIEAEVEQGKAGVLEVRYRGGIIKTGFRSVTFPSTKEPEKKPNLDKKYSFVVVPEGKGKTATVQTSANVQALYRFADGSEKPLSYVMFKKSLKVEIESIQKLSVSAYNVKDRTAECELYLKDGMQLSVTLMGVIPLDGGKTATLVGLVGDVPAGYKMFPIHTFESFQAGEVKLDPEKKDPPKKK